MIDTIKFTYNWNGKLNNHAFTTVRLHNSKKYTVGALYMIECKNITTFAARIIDIRTLKLAQFNEWMAYLDTGYNLAEFKKVVHRMYSKKVNLDTAEFDFILLVKNGNKK